MLVLGIDGSGLVASVAAASEDSLLAEYTVNYKKTHSQTLLPMLDEIIRMLDVELKEIDAIAVAAGPGSFTGLRIASSTAKGLAMALEKPIISIPTLEGLAFNLYGTDRLICPMMDARRNQVYTGLYESGDHITTIWEQRAAAIEEVVAEINQRKRPVIYLGDGAWAYQEYIKKETHAPFLFAPSHLARQRAGGIAVLGIQYFKEGKIETAQEHRPFYLRESQAERERKEKHGRMPE